MVAHRAEFVVVQPDSLSPAIFVDRNHAGIDNVPVNEFPYEEQICGDGFGFLSNFRPFDGGSPFTCAFCDLHGIEQDAERSWHQAERVWNISNRAPFEAGGVLANCARTVWQRGLRLQPGNRALRMALAKFRLASSEPLERQLAWATWDALTDTLMKQGNMAAAANVLADAGTTLLDRALALLQRPDARVLPLSMSEAAVRALKLGAPALVRLPPLPDAPSVQLGVTELQYAERLLQRATELAPDSLRLRKLALIPAAWQNDGRTLGAMAAKFLAANPIDSIAWPAHALARFLSEGYTLGVVATFDSLLRILPRVDSARYDALDEVVARNDADWQFGFLPDKRLALERRTWSVLDPMWMTPVNEIRLAEMVRVATADLRYVRDAAPGIAGSETPAGVMLRRRGMPDARWRRAGLPNLTSIPCRFGPNTPFTCSGSLFLPGSLNRLDRGWSTFIASIDIDYDRGELGNVRSAFYGNDMTLNRMAVRPAVVSNCPWDVVVQSALVCARAEQAIWNDVPYQANKDTIDVELARFRATAADSAEVYVAARVPVRQFRTRNTRNSSAGADVRIAAWIKTPSGDTIAHDERRRTLRGYRAPTWTEQWHFALAAQPYMHRVEAMNASTGAAAWGHAIRPADEAAGFLTSGFGISDVLVAKSLTETHTVPRRWHDLQIEPSAGVVAPRGTMGVAWEIYDLTPNSSGRCQWSVGVSLKPASDLKRPGFQQLIIGSAVDSRSVADSVQPGYRLVRNAAALPVIVDHLNVGVGNAESGMYLLQVTVTDLVSMKSVVGKVQVRVLDDAVQNAQPAPAPGGRLRRDTGRVLASTH